MYSFRWMSCNLCAYSDKLFRIHHHKVGPTDCPKCGGKQTFFTTVAANG